MAPLLAEGCDILVVRSTIVVHHVVYIPVPVQAVGGGGDISLGFCCEER